MYGGGDLNWLSEERLVELLGPEFAELAAERREEQPFVSVWELLTIPGIATDLVERLVELGIHCGPLIDDEVDLRPMPPVAVDPWSSLDAIPFSERDPTGELFLGLSHTLAAVGALFHRQNQIQTRLGTGDEEGAEVGVQVPDTRVDKFIRVPTHHGPPHDFTQRRVTLPAYCVVAWILTNGVAGAVGNGGSPHGAGSAAVAGAAGAAGLRTPNQAGVNGVAADIRTANANVFSTCDLGFRLCRVHVLDTTVARTANGQQSLANALFNNAGVVYSSPGDPLQELYDALSANFPKLFDLKCVNVFYVGDVQISAQKPDNPAPGGRSLTGLGSDMTPGGRVRNPPHTPMALIEGGWTTFAHEAIHGMGVAEHASQSNDPLVVADPNNIMKEANGGASIQASQCQRINAYAKKYLRQGCP